MGVAQKKEPILSPILNWFMFAMIQKKPPAWRIIRSTWQPNQTPVINLKKTHLPLISAGYYRLTQASD